MGNVSILFHENDKLYTIHEVSALTGLPVRELQCTVRRQDIKGITYRTKNEICEVIVPLSAMAEII
ncbi:MAG: hypothetical protein AB9903_27580 [Vulcanimicrobiota bacterium]